MRIDYRLILTPALTIASHALAQTTPSTSPPRQQCSPAPGARSTTAVDQDHICVTGGNGLVACHKAADGQIGRQ